MHTLHFIFAFLSAHAYIGMAEFHFVRRCAPLDNIVAHEGMEQKVAFTGMAVKGKMKVSR